MATMTEKSREATLRALRFDAKTIWEQYVLGNKSDARLLFMKLPANQQGYVAAHITLNASTGFADGDNVSSETWAGEVIKFFESVTG